MSPMAKQNMNKKYRENHLSLSLLVLDSFIQPRDVECANQITGPESIIVCFFFLTHKVPSNKYISPPKKDRLSEVKDQSVQGSYLVELTPQSIHSFGGDSVQGGEKNRGDGGTKKKEESHESNL